MLQIASTSIILIYAYSGIAVGWGNPNIVDGDQASIILGNVQFSFVGIGTYLHCEVRKILGIKWYHSRVSCANILYEKDLDLF